MGKRKEESVSKPRSHKRQRQEFTDEHSDGLNDEENLLFSFDSNLSSVSTVGEVGIIESIQLKNFMCHSMLGPFQFGSNLNFVVGNNGSGKSSVLTALIVGLGGKATATNRGSSLKMFVKTGATSADISITLRNQGRDAFKPEVYGDSIIVNQHITLEGSRSYRLKSKSGTVVSSKKEELLGILDHFNIQVDNPMSVLTQEMSKHFLQSKNEGDKYKFFMKATQLEQMKEDYSYIMKTKENTSLQIEQGEERLQELKQLYNEKKERYKSIGYVNEMRNHLEELKHKMAWAVVGEMEREIQPIREGIRAEEGNTEKFDQKLEECQVKLNEAEEKYKTIQEKLGTINEEAETLQPRCILLKADVQARRKAVNEAEVLYNRVKTELKRLGKDDEQLRNRIEEMKNSANRVSVPEKMEKQRKIAQLKEKLQAFHNEEVMIGQQMDQFQQAIYKHKEEDAKLRREEGDMKQELDAKQKQLRELRDSKTNIFKRFGQHVPSFLEAVETAYRQGHFKRKPVGPLGAFIHPKDAELSLAIESCLKSLVQAFCCDNHSDERVLQQLMTNHYPRGLRPSIIVNKFQDKVYDVRHRGVHHPEFPSVLTALEIDDPVVANCLIDMRGIEKILLIKSSRKAREVMQSNNPPRNCREAFTVEGDQVFDRRYYSSDYRRPKYLSKNVEAEINHLESEVANRKAQLTACQRHLYSIQNEIRRNEDHLHRHRQHQKELQIKIRTTKAEIADLENTEENQSVDIRILEDVSEENKKKMESAKKEMQEQSRRMEELNNILQEAEKRFEEIKEKIHQVEEIAGPIKDELSKADSEVENRKRRWQHYEDRKKEHLACIKKHKELLAAKEKELEEKTAQARQIYAERIEVSRTVKSLDAEMNRLRERINSEKNHHGNREEIIQQFLDAKERYEDANIKVKNLKRFIMLLEEIMTQRFRIYRQFLRLLSLRCKLYFDYLLRIRACCGKILFDHKNETLSITVQPGEEDKAALNDVRSLSGGERSFSTVCFILSLWSITESPFRCLDEFDVYMDMVNRRIAMDMILKVADSQRHRQFILLTPQSMSSLPTSSHIRILRMQDPERGQTQLNFHNRNEEEEDD
ncbi:structural maintenance of chromosomes protein 6 isoform X1 [Anas platyrhynchos]|uniref:Structural maintenance of chromosomes protein 6 n=3 Tax=Anas TaxID=8835 RepID=U3IN04_ANAPP|nr:structural maintenance of chromosomes protein 6 isoform X1 [Anas platyrhynchos]XP_005015106.1 structural maintenance of chromosomes protein 6 isoform X1 [Anas platyrhynchos]XP_005015107.1 structural maintenance of chromosomes protein 6 isoform X1 [Anas platyrhynchos]XP_005015108.1 structural maintenance of chromosomes protein 6 isoform X1 [Anas platyrhynchos]|eukprot:XP_005015105.1 structural maintenance of chromosomes protein 6 isoform X1 [Anas platyrhynchos]